MGDVVALSGLSRPRRRRDAAVSLERRGEIVLFTGVRIDRWPEARDGSKNEPSDGGAKTPRRRRRRP